MLLSNPVHLGRVKGSGCISRSSGLPLPSLKLENPDLDSIARKRTGPGAEVPRFPSCLREVGRACVRCTRCAMPPRDCMARGQGYRQQQGKASLCKLSVATQILCRLMATSSCPYPLDTCEARTTCARLASGSHVSKSKKIGLPDLVLRRGHSRGS